MVQYAVADKVMNACRHCSTIGRFRYRTHLQRGMLPNADEPTATVTFIKFGERTYAVTAAHVIEAFENLRSQEGILYEGYFCPANSGVAIFGPFITPPPPLAGRTLDVAISPIDPDLPAYIGKETFVVARTGDATWPVSHALAVGFPTASKEDVAGPDGVRLSMACVHALAEGVGGRGDADQVQFFSELAEKPAQLSLSGLSGGPVFWSEAESFGLLGFIKEALDVVPKEGEETLYEGPRVNFICQRVDYEMIEAWTTYVDRNWQRARDKINAVLK
jgi:hypothetical protein